MATCALLVGIDDYPPPLPPLRGCVADVADLAELLAGRAAGLRPLTLLDAATTRAALTAGLRDHLGRAGPADVAVLVFCGHGSQATAAPGSAEPDRLDETIVLADSRLPGGWDLTDDELAGLLAGIRARHLLVVLDCCHSGTATRGEGAPRERRVPRDERDRPPESYLPGPPAGPGEAVRGQAPAAPAGPAAQVLLAACRQDETAKEIPDGGADRGAFTAALTGALRTAGAITYREVHRAATARVLAHVRDQHPQLETADAADLDRPFLGGALAPVPPSFTLTHGPDGWVLDGGAVHGLVAAGPGGPSRLLVLGTGAGVGAVLTSATVTALGPGNATVELARELDPGGVYRAIVVTAPLVPLTVDLDPGCEDVRALLEDASSVLSLAQPPGTGRARVGRVDGGYGLRDVAHGTSLTPDVTGDGAAERVVAALEHVSRWRRLSDLRNPSTSLASGAVAVTLRGGGVTSDGDLSLRYDPGPPTFLVELHNTTAERLWVALVDLTETYGIYADALPGGSLALGAGETTEVSLRGEVPALATRHAVTDHLKVVVATVEFDLRPLGQVDLDVTTVSRAPVVRSGFGGLGALVGAATTRGVSLDASDAVPDWRTLDHFVTVVGP